MSFFEKLRPARSAAKESELIADLDAMIAEPIAFRLHGKNHEILPISTKDFLKFSIEYEKIFGDKNKGGMTPEQVVERCYRMFKTLIPTISKNDIDNMNQAQVGALFSLVVDMVTGKAHVSDPKDYTTQKKNPMLRAQG